MKVTKYTPEQWEQFAGQEAEDEVAFFVLQPGDVPLGVYAGAQMKDGTYSIYGLGRDMTGLSYEQMVSMLHEGLDDEEWS